MQAWTEFMVASLVPLAGGLLFFPTLRLGTWRRVALLAPLCVLIFLSPLLVAGEFHLTRFSAAALALTVAGKLVDLHVGALRGRRPEWRAYRHSWSTSSSRSSGRPISSRASVAGPT